MVKKLLLFLIVLMLIFLVSYILGPTVQYSQVNATPMELDIPLDQLDLYVSDVVNTDPRIKPDNEARILWQDSLQKTEYAVVYLHGFEASWAESDPIIKNFAERYNCNTYLSRISQQALNDLDALAEESPEGMIESAKQAIAIGKLLGDKLIVLSCSTGSTYSAYLAASDPEIYAQIMTAPNFDLEDPNSKILTGPWGKQILRKMIGGDYRSWEANEAIVKYWNDKYRIEGLIALRALLDQTMTPDIWKKNKTPYFIGYYYKDDIARDNIISIDAINEFNRHATTETSAKKVIAFDNAKGHVISSDLMNPNWESVQDSIFSYVEEVLYMKPAPIPSENPEF